MSLTDTRLEESKRISMREIVDKLGLAGLRPAGQELVGPCPVCGGNDRFAINTRTHLSNCRKCGLRAGDQVGLVMEVQGLKFTDALKWLMGDPVAIDETELARRRERYRKQKEKDEADAARYRQYSIAAGKRIWNEASGEAAADLWTYLVRRGLPSRLASELAPVLRYAPALPYVRKIGRDNVTLHTGPAMVAKIMGFSTDFIGAHCTWLDPTRPGKKALIETRKEDNRDKPWPAKLIKGSMKGGAITLTNRRAPVLVVGEGIETTLTAMAYSGLEDADFWAGVSLGNMSGVMWRDPNAPRKPSGWPDLTDKDAFVPPPWVKRLIFIQDGDSAHDATRAKLLAGLRRAMWIRPELTGHIVYAGKGVDLNDLVQEGVS